MLTALPIFVPVCVRVRVCTCGRALLRGSGQQAVRLSPSRYGSFEVRFGANAVSQRMPRPPPSQMIQVNLGNENSRIVDVFDRP